MTDAKLVRITLSYPEAARAMGVSDRFLRGLVARGEGPKVVRLGTRVVIRPEAIQEWLAEKEGRQAA